MSLYTMMGGIRFRISATPEGKRVVSPKEAVALFYLVQAAKGAV